MSEFSFNVLGANSGMPAQGRHPSAHILKIGKEQFLIDCGEGTQLQMSKYGINRGKIDHIFISHLHGDHVFGLAGLLTSYNHLGRTSPIHIYSTVGIKELIETQLRLSGSEMRYKLLFHEYDLGPDLTQAPQLILDHQHVSVYAIPLRHRIPTIGFIFREKIGERRLHISEVRRLGISVDQYKEIKRGQDGVTSEGQIIDNRLLTFDPYPIRSLAYCTDTIYDERIIPYISGVDVLYHEATFATDLLDKAEATMHSTAGQAAMIAKKARVGHLLLGHYSSRYRRVDGLESEAKAVFADSQCVQEGRSYSLDRDLKMDTQKIK